MKITIFIVGRLSKLLSLVIEKSHWYKDLLSFQTNEWEQEDTTLFSYLLNNMELKI